MEKPEGLAKAAAMMAIVAALATILAVNLPPEAGNARNTRGGELRTQEIPVPAMSARGGAGAAQGRGAAVERREAGGGRAPKQSSKSEL